MYHYQLLEIHLLVTDLQLLKNLYKFQIFKIGLMHPTIVWYICQTLSTKSLVYVSDYKSPEIPTGSEHRYL